MCNRECLNPFDPEQQKGLYTFTVQALYKIVNVNVYNMLIYVVCIYCLVHICSILLHSSSKGVSRNARERNGESVSSPRVSSQLLLIRFRERQLGWWL